MPKPLATHPVYGELMAREASVLSLMDWESPSLDPSAHQP